MSGVLNFGAQAVHGHGEGVVVNKIAAAVPQLFQQKPPCHHSPGIGRQKPQELVFVGRNGQFLAAPEGGQGVEIQAEESVVKTAVSGLGGAPAQDRLYPALEDLNAEGLGDVVVRAQVEAGQLVPLQVVGGQENDRLFRSGEFDFPAEVKAASVGKVYVQNYQVEGVGF